MVISKSRVHEGTIEARDGPSIHFFVGRIPAVHPDNNALVAVKIRIKCWTAQCFRPVGS